MLITVTHTHPPMFNSFSKGKEGGRGRRRGREKGRRGRGGEEEKKNS